MPPTIPPRQPPGDPFTGGIVSAGDRHALATQPPAGSTAQVFVVRYGLRYLGKPFLSIVPGLIALDYGEFLTGDAAWEFAIRRSNLHPRAEVFGYRSDGRDEIMYMKNLDIAAGIEVLAYVDETATVPLARITALIASADEAATLPARLTTPLPRYETAIHWLETPA